MLIVLMSVLSMSCVNYQIFAPAVRNSVFPIYSLRRITIESAKGKSILTIIIQIEGKLSRNVAATLILY